MPTSTVRVDSYSPTMKYLIYGLVDPRTLMVRYVGKSTSAMRRPMEHVRPWSRRIKSHKNHWIASLALEGLQYEVAVLQESSCSLLGSDERWWIAYGRACGWPLTNATDGGDGTTGYRASDETRRRQSEARRGRKHTAAWTAKIAAANTGKRHSAEAIARMRAAKIGKRGVQTADGRRRIGEATRKRNALPEWLWFIRAVGHSNLGRKRSSETKQKLSESHRGIKQSEETKAKRRATWAAKRALRTGDV